MAGGAGKIQEYVDSLTKEEQKKLKSMAGKASGKARREKKSMQQTADIILNLYLNGDKPADIEKVKSIQEIKSANVTVKERIIMGLAVDAMKGDTRASRLLMELMGELSDKKEINLTGAVPVMFVDEGKLED